MVYIVAAERSLLPRAQAAHRTLKLLRFLIQSRQGPEPLASGYQGFYYHFLHLRSGQRQGTCELSTIDTALLVAGILTATAYYAHSNAVETEIRDLGTKLYERVNWQWALNGAKTFSQGWTPERGFQSGRWDRGYCEAHLLYILALGAPAYAIAPAGYREWVATFVRKQAYGFDYIYAGPLFIHQFAALWLDFRGIFDDVNRDCGWDYFENSRRATLVHRCYGIAIPLGFKLYGENCWGLTASNGPGPGERMVDGTERHFFGYKARGAPEGPDDGTVAPWAAAASLPFAPAEVTAAIRYGIEALNLRVPQLGGLEASFNATFPGDARDALGWTSPKRYGINEGPTIIMIENYRSELVWRLMRNLPAIRRGLRQAGFQGGWLEAVVHH